MGQSRLHHKGAGPHRAQFWGSIRIMHTPFVTEIPNLTG